MGLIRAAAEPPSAASLRIEARESFAIHETSTLTLPAGAGWGLDKFFTLKEVLGSGSVASVYRAVRLSDGEEVAVKRMPAEDEEQRQIAREEWQLLQKLDHPSILRAEALYECHNSAHIVMQLCRGCSLESRVRRKGPLAEPQAAMLAAQLFEGLNYLHCMRIVHRDIKPANLLLVDATATRLKLADFNSARRVGGERGGSCSTMLTDRGTASFRAPELQLGRIWNERVDIWAAGMSIFFMLEGQLPLRVEDSSVLVALSQGRLPEIVPVRPQSEGMQNLVLQCLTVDVRYRPPAMELLLHPVIEPFCPPMTLANSSADDEQEGQVFTLNARCGLIATTSSFCESKLQARPFLHKSSSISSVSTMSTLPDMEDVQRCIDSRLSMALTDAVTSRGERAAPAFGPGELRLLQRVAVNCYRRTAATTVVRQNGIQQRPEGQL